MSTNGTVYDDGSFKYAVFNGAGTSVDYTTIVVPLKIMTVPVIGTVGSCAFSIIAAPPSPVIQGNWGVDGRLSGLSSPFMEGQIIAPNSVVFPYATISGTTTICNGSNTTLTASDGSGSYTYLWSPGGATTASIRVNQAMIIRS
jgi:hypothetical protein